MPEPLHVLTWGTAKDGPCAYFRGYAYDDLLRERGIETKHISKIELAIEPGWEDRPDEAMRTGHAAYDLSDLEWADVFVFRRYYNTSFACEGKDFEKVPGSEELGCGWLSRDENEAAHHPHGAKVQDTITRQMWPVIRDHAAERGKGILYETDDLHVGKGVQKWNGYWKAVELEREVIRDMASRADLVTVATPALLKEYRRYNSRIRVVRNAIDPSLYVKDTPRPEGDKPRLVYYGSTARMRDYMGRFLSHNTDDGQGGAMRAVQEQKDRLTRVFLGTNPGTEHIIGQLFDEQQPYITGIAAFSKALANTHGDIGIAPLGGDDFDRCKSELHWLEYAMSDMAFIGQRFMEGGPYSVIRPGVDGLLARSARDWSEAMKQLVDSKNLREQLAGAAKERVLRDYTLEARADEWADAYRYVANNAGIGQQRVAA